MNIAVDSGNTYSKIGWFDGDQLVRYQIRLPWADLIEAVRGSTVDKIIYSSVSHTVETFVNALGLDVPVMDLTGQTPVPIKKNYKTPHTLGADRVAAAVGANWLFPQTDLLVIDMGTCITYDLVDREATSSVCPYQKRLKIESLVISDQ